MSEPAPSRIAHLPTIAARRRGVRTPAEYAAVHGVSLEAARTVLDTRKEARPDDATTALRQNSREFEAMAGDLAEELVKMICSMSARLPPERAARMNEGIGTILTALRGVSVAGTNSGDRKRAKAIVAAVMVEYDIDSVGEFFGPRRVRTVARPRQMAMALVREHCGAWSLPQIGRFFGGRDHTTVMHACKKHVLYMRRVDYAETVARVMASVAKNEP